MIFKQKVSFVRKISCWRSTFSHKNAHAHAHSHVENVVKSEDKKPIMDDSNFVIILKLSYSNFRWSNSSNRNLSVYVADSEWMIFKCAGVPRVYGPASTNLNTNRKHTQIHTIKPMLDKYYAILVEFSCNKLYVSFCFYFLDLLPSHFICIYIYEPQVCCVLVTSHHIVPTSKWLKTNCEMERDSHPDRQTNS